MRCTAPAAALATDRQTPILCIAKYRCTGQARPGTEEPHDDGRESPLESRLAAGIGGGPARTDSRASARAFRPAVVGMGRRAFLPRCTSNASHADGRSAHAGARTVA